jgi:hypothetical protein
MMRELARLAVAGALMLGMGGCGGDDDSDPVTPASTASTQAAPAPTTTAPEAPQEPDEPRYRRTPASLAKCLEAEPGISQALVKGSDSEDATFFADLAAGPVQVLGVTVKGEPAELTVVLFQSEAEAEKAAPSAGGGGVSAEAHGSALVLVPSGADAAPIHACLGETGYATG